MLKFETWKIVVILLVSLLGPLYTMPNLLSEDTREWMGENLPAWVPHRAMSLGLDLQGGSHLQLQVDMTTVVADRIESMQSAARLELRQKKIGMSRARIAGQSVIVTLRDEEDADKAIEAFRQSFGFGISIKQEGADIALAYSDTELSTFKKQAVAQSIEIIRRRIDETGTKEPIIQMQGDDRILVQLPGMKDPERVKQLLGKTARLTFHMVDTDTSTSQCLDGSAPLSVRCVPDAESPGYLVPVMRRALLTGDRLVDAQPAYDQNSQPIVNFRFDSLGARTFGQVTADNVGKPFAVVLDDQVITAPRINEPILGGSGQISGNFTVQSANDLAILLRAGALPAPLKVVEERTVGPSLGADSIDSGKVASVVATFLVMGFMIVVYGWRFGMFANIALVVNITLMIAMLSLLGATLTLPGIVGIVLSIGMAVDANVLIFERMREEMRAGRKLMPTVDYGFQGAMSSIIDANVTSLISAVVLYCLGTGPVRGFAVTLSLGIVSSMFTCIYLTRLIVVLYVNRVKPKVLPL
jgi:preprotein translocase subunit SecD